MERAGDGEHDTWSVRLIAATPPALELWRVIGDEPDIAAYAAAHTPSSSAKKNGDWSGMYFQLSAGNAAGTLGYRWDQGYTMARLIRVSLPLAEFGFVALVVDDTGNGAQTPAETETQGRGLMVASDVPGAFKAAQLKSRLDIPSDTPLLPALGQRQTPAVLVCRESVGEWEVAVPHDLLPVMSRGAAWEERCVVEFRPRAGVTAEARLCGAMEGGAVRWRRWRDGDPVVMADEAIDGEAFPRWLSDALSSRTETG